MAVSNMNLICALVLQLHVKQALACGDDSGRTENILFPKNFNSGI